MNTFLNFMTVLKNKKVIIVSIIAVVLLATAGVYYLFIYKGEKSKEGVKDRLQKVDVGVDFNIGVDAGNVGQGAESVLKNMPATNPLEEVANPFRDAYKNPFE